jgi:gluconate 2-dehydrogenase gamma chain
MDPAIVPGSDTPLMGRRKALQLFGLLGAGGALAAKALSNPVQGAGNAAAAPEALPPADFALLRRLTEIIIPRTETAGAIEAGVPEFIASVLPAISGEELALMAENVDLTSDNPPVLFADGFRWIDDRARSAHGRDFMSMTESEQAELLASLYAAAESGQPVGRGPQFLHALKALTVEAYYTSREGLIDELGYKGNKPHFMMPDKTGSS